MEAICNELFQLVTLITKKKILPVTKVCHLLKTH